MIRKKIYTEKSSLRFLFLFIASCLFCFIYMSQSVQAVSIMKEVPENKITIKQTIEQVNNSEGIQPRPKKRFQIDRSVKPEILVQLEGYAPMTQSEYAMFQQAQTEFLGATTTSGSSHAYYWGWCAWYVANFRDALNLPVGSHWGNAYQWADSARLDGYLVNSSPKVGSIAVDSYSNHVMAVEAVLADGSIQISEGGWNFTPGNYNRRIIDANTAANYLYIH